jgi:membrane protein DedA with SNARE-associated domain
MLEIYLKNLFLFFERLGDLGIFLNMALENLGIPLPTEIGYLLAQRQIEESLFRFWLMLLLLNGGHIFGASIAYALGFSGNNFVLKWLGRNAKFQRAYHKLKGWYQRYGSVTVFAIRFIGYLRPWSSFVAGFAKMPFWLFFLWTLLGSFIFNIAALIFSDLFIRIWHRYQNLHLWLFFAMFILFFGAIIYETLHLFFQRIRRLKRRA